MGGVDLFLDGYPAIVLLIDRSCQANEDLTKALLAFLFPNVIFCLPDPD